jgi:hypothetical protein
MIILILTSFLPLHFLYDIHAGLTYFFTYTVLDTANAALSTSISPVKVTFNQPPFCKRAQSECISTGGAATPKVAIDKVSVTVNTANIGAGSDVNSLVFDYGYYKVTTTNGAEFLTDSPSFKGVSTTTASFPVLDAGKVYLYVCARDPYGGKVRDHLHCIH